ncbi:MTG2 [Candida pseudojiufengensis]|uniref:MTG2 n=1 Tax=Candida pseudojiufengensis TaxID=497109 RepID=UPI002225B484|nr:MTG2 [Candida pseudojiufengensis]KAI5962501.1 MTG2 [Candida pseudojiufengensis]
MKNIRLLQRYRLHTSTRLSNYSLHNSIPQDLPTTTISNPKNEEQIIKISQLPNSRLISISDYFSGNSNHLHHVFYSNLIQNRSRRALKIEKKKFIDLKTIKLSSGNGGNGSISFFKDNLKSFGPPDGGDGGNGGNIYFNVVDKNLNSLHYLNKKYIAKSGENGKRGQLDGKNGEDIIIDIPLGTIIRWIPDPLEFKKYITNREGQSLDDIFMELEIKDNKIQLNRNSYKSGEGWLYRDNEPEYYHEKEFFQELNTKVLKYDEELEFEEQQQDQFPLFGIDCDELTEKPILFLKGGKGGLGNMHFLTSNIRNPKFCKIGRSGITENFLLELKLIADLGLIGLPNAGKSSLLRAISNAKPRVGHWEFTTLQPTIGTIQYKFDTPPFTVADIPGIIKGASENKGMGLDFLRHIERSGGMCFVVSLESEDPTADLNLLINEVGSKRMENKKVLVVATKADLSNEGENFKILKNYIETKFKDWKIVPVCAPRGENIDKCLQLMSETAEKGRSNLKEENTVNNL